MGYVLKAGRLFFALSIIVLLWVLILHLPGALATPGMGNSNALTATFHALGFSGISFMIAGLLMQNPEALSYKQFFSAKLQHSTN